MNKSSVRLTKTIVDRLPVPDTSGKQRLVFDAELEGFGVLISGKTEAKSYIVQRDVNGNTRRITVGRTNVITLDEARRKAMGLLAQLADGVDLKEEKRRALANAMTLDKALTSYLEAWKALKPKTIDDYKRNVDRYFSDWKNRPLRSISREMVAARHTQIAAEINDRAKKAEAKRKATEAEPSRSLVKVTGDSSANGAMRVLRLIFNHAIALTGSLETTRSSASSFKEWILREGFPRGAFWAAVAALSRCCSTSTAAGWKEMMENIVRIAATTCAEEYRDNFGQISCSVRNAT